MRIFHSILVAPDVRTHPPSTNLIIALSEGAKVHGPDGRLMYRHIVHVQLVHGVRYCDRQWMHIPSSYPVSSQGWTVSIFHMNNAEYNRINITTNIHKYITSISSFRHTYKFRRWKCVWITKKTKTWDCSHKFDIFRLFQCKGGSGAIGAIVSRGQGRPTDERYNWIHWSNTPLNADDVNWGAARP